jgi:hypothetical protein
MHFPKCTPNKLQTVFFELARLFFCLALGLRSFLEWFFLSHFQSTLVFSCWAVAALSSSSGNEKNIFCWGVRSLKFLFEVLGLRCCFFVGGSCAFRFSWWAFAFLFGRCQSVVGRKMFCWVSHELARSFFFFLFSVALAEFFWSGAVGAPCWALAVFVWAVAAKGFVELAWLTFSFRAGLAQFFVGGVLSVFPAGLTQFCVWAVMTGEFCLSSRGYLFCLAFLGLRSFLEQRFQIFLLCFRSFMLGRWQGFLRICF